MIKWDSVFEWGRRASDRPIADPRLARRATRCSRAQLRTSRSRFSSSRRSSRQAAGSSAPKRLRAGPSRASATALFARAEAAGLDRAAVAAGAAQGAAQRRGLGRRAQGPQAVDQPPAEDCVARRLRRNGCWTRSRPLGWIPRGSRSRSPKARCWSTSRRSPAASRGCATPGLRIAVDDFGTGYASLAYLTHASARHDQDRPRADCRHRRRRARPDRGQGDDPPCPRARPQGRGRRASRAPPSWSCSPTGAATSTRASSAPERSTRTSCRASSRHRTRRSGVK